MSTERTGMVLIPAFNEAGHIAAVVTEVAAHGLPVVVVDDGSADDSVARAKDAGAHVIVHDTNKGKGAALNTGFAYARESGFAFVITMDADGQHAPDDIPVFVDAFQRGGGDVLVGNRMAHTETMPVVRRWTNRFMSWLLSREMGQRVPDTQNGFRLYRTSVIPDLSTGSQRFAAESEILLELASRGVEIGAVPVKIIYGDEESKIHPFRDTVRFFGMLRRFRKAHNE